MRALHKGVGACTFRLNPPIDAAHSVTEGSSSILFWLLAIAITAIACAALYYAAAGRTVNAPAGAVDDATAAHYRLQLRELDTDIASGRLGEAEGVAARGEMARELIRLKGEGRTVTDRQPKGAFIIAVAATAILAFGAYGVLGRPDLPGVPLDTRPAEPTIEQTATMLQMQLEQNPDDLGRWKALAHLLMQLQRFGEAEFAYRRVIEIGGVTADAETDLAEAVMFRQGGSAEGEPLTLLKSAAARDPAHARSRFYLAAEATRVGQYEEAVGLWNELIALSTGDEPWLPTAKNGLAVATAGLNGEALPDDPAIAAMVEGLKSRLEAEGGSVEDWTMLVRSHLQLGQIELAQAAYDKARAAYPDAAVRTELDVLAADHGLVAN
jgi:cytochrome c-type biogenesis protein CcmH